MPGVNDVGGPIRRWLHRHLLVWRILVLGGVDLIADTTLKGLLPLHSAHHDFPWIPGSRLPVASERMAAVLCRCGHRPVVSVASYREALTRLNSFEVQQPS